MTSLQPIVFEKACAPAGAGLSHLQLKLLWSRHLIEPPEKQAVLSPYAALLLWTAELLAKSWLTVDAQQLVLTTIDTRLPSWANAIWCAIGEGASPRLIQLVFTDGRYFTYTDGTQFLDLTTGEPFHAKHMPIESIAYNLTQLFCRRYQDACRA